MNDIADEKMRETLDSVYQQESRRVLATLIRLLGDFDLAEDALHDAFAAAMKQWPKDGVPGNPRAWLVSAGRFKAIDNLRRRARFDASLTEYAERLNSETPEIMEVDSTAVNDDQLRLIFYLLPSCLAGRRPHCAYSSRSMWSYYRRNCASISHLGSNGRSAHCTR